MWADQSAKLRKLPNIEILFFFCSHSWGKAAFGHFPFGPMSFGEAAIRISLVEIAVSSAKESKADVHLKQTDDRTQPFDLALVWWTPKLMRISAWRCHMTKPRPYKRFSSECKREAILRAGEEGMTDKAVCDKLGVSI